jgi:hypothetical protein
MNNIKRYMDAYGYYTEEQITPFDGLNGLLEIDWMNDLVNHDLHVELLLDRKGFFRVPGCNLGQMRLICRQWRHYPGTEHFESLLHTNFAYYNRVVGVVDQDVPELKSYKAERPEVNHWI